MNKYPLSNNTILIPLLLSCLLLPACQRFERTRRYEKMRLRLETGTASERIKTLQKIADDPHPVLRTTLENILTKDADTPLARALAAEALGNLKDKRSADKLLFHLQHDTESIVRGQSLVALAAIEQKASDGVLLYALRNDRATVVRITALDLAVQVLDRNRALKLLEEGINDAAPSVRLTAYHHLKDLTGLDIPPDARSRWREELNKLK